MLCALLRSQGPSSKSKKGSAPVTKALAPATSPDSASGGGGKDSGSKKPKGLGSGAKSATTKVPSFPLAEELAKGSRVEHVVDGVTYEAVILTLGTREKLGQARIGYVSQFRQFRLRYWRHASVCSPRRPYAPQVRERARSGAHREGGGEDVGGARESAGLTT